MKSRLGTFKFPTGQAPSPQASHKAEIGTQTLTSQTEAPPTPRVQAALVAPTAVGIETSTDALAVGKVYRVSLSLLDADPYNARFERSAQDIKNMESWLEQDGGQLDPGSGYCSNGRIYLTDGVTRLLALRNRNAPSYTVLIKEYEPNPLERYLESRAHNAHANPQTALDDAEAFAQLLTEQQIDNKQLAERLGITPGAVSQRLAIRRIPRDLRSEMANFDVLSSASIAYEISRLFNDEKTAEEGRRLVLQFAAHLRASEDAELSRNEVRAKVDSITAPRARTQKPHARTQQYRLGEKSSGTLKVWAEQGRLELKIEQADSRLLADLEAAVASVLAKKT